MPGLPDVTGARSGLKQSGVPEGDRVNLNRSGGPEGESRRLNSKGPAPIV